MYPIFQLTSSLDNFFGGNGGLFGMPVFRIGFRTGSDEEPERSGLFPEQSSFGKMFQQMHEQMSSMVNRMMGQAAALERGENPESGISGSNGRLIVVKSGPGYSEQKTYDFGPDGVKKEVKVTGHKPIAIQNDESKTSISAFFHFWGPIKNVCHSKDVLFMP